MVARNGARNGNGLTDLRGLSRGATYRLDPYIGQELAIHALVRSLSGDDPATNRAIVEAALRDWFKKHPISKKQRDAAELLMSSRGRNQ